jgi:uncharacterized protein (TIGR02145 family)
MKTIFTTIIAGLLSLTAFSQVGIGTTNPNSSALLDISSNSKGLLLPRVTFSQRNSITPITGLQLYCTDCGSGPGELQIYNGTSWSNAAGSAASGLVFSPPTNVVAVPGTTQALVSFTAPTATMGAPVTSYTVTSTPGGITATGTSSPIRVSGLTEATAYTFSVVATNSNSVSSTSSASSASKTTISSTDTFAKCDGTRVTDIVEISSTTGKIWMDRNLGANRAAQSMTDNYAYGCLYQWGRGNDGHANMNYTTATNGIKLASGWANNIRSTTATPNNTLIYSEEPTYTDWLVTPNPNLWQGVNGINNPCPSGFRLPTIIEIENENTAYSISSSNANSAYTNGPGGGFKFTKGSFRYYGDTATGGTIINVGLYGFYWSSSVNINGTSKRFRLSESFINTTQDANRNHGHSVRCIKN